jgi:hypothetical protein
MCQNSYYTLVGGFMGWDFFDRILVALCPRCHLALHSRGKGNVSEGQKMGLLGEA